MSDTMRRIRAYKDGTEVRGKSRPFQRKMLKHLVQSTKQRQIKKEFS